MNRYFKTLLALAGAVLLVAGTATLPVSAQQPAAAAPKMVAPIRGQANLGVTKPATTTANIEGRTWIITKMKVKNLSAGAIAGLKADEFWHDKAGNPVGGDTFRYRKPLQPNEVIELEFKTPRDPKMNTNQYKFSHANGDIKTQLVPKL